MKKMSFIIILLLLSFLPVYAENPKQCLNKEQNLPNIFIYHIPEDSEISKGISETVTSNNNNNNNNNLKVITSDDITADTSQDSKDLTISEEDEDSENYEISDMYSDVLKGYAEYTEGEEDTITLDENLDKTLSINLKKPETIKGQKYLAKPHLLFGKTDSYSRFNNMEYSISPVSNTNTTQKGHFSTGTIYEQGIDYAEFEQSTGVFSRFDTKHFAISSAYKKTINSTNNNYNDNFYFSPELKLNQYFTLRETLSADIVKNIRKAEFTVSINPFGDRDKNRLLFELGTSSIFDSTNTLLKNQFKFSTNIKL